MNLGQEIERKARRTSEKAHTEKVNSGAYWPKLHAKHRTIMKRSKIEWTDYSGGLANFIWRGRNDCKCSPGCYNCYVDRIIARHKDRWPEHTTFFPDKLNRLSRVRPSPGKLQYRRGAGSRPMVFVCDIGDLFHEMIDDHQIDLALGVFQSRQDIDWQILTKRPFRMTRVVREWLRSSRLYTVPYNIWLGFSACNQEQFDDGWESLCDIPGIIFTSCEPMLDRVVPWHPEDSPSWIICGGESGKGARPMYVDSVRDLRDVCVDWEIPLFFKQWGDAPPHYDGDVCSTGYDVSAKRGGDILDGKTHKEFPVMQLELL